MLLKDYSPVRLVTDSWKIKTSKSIQQNQSCCLFLFHTFFFRVKTWHLHYPQQRKSSDITWGNLFDFEQLPLDQQKDLYNILSYMKEHSPPPVSKFP